MRWLLACVVAGAWCWAGVRLAVVPGRSGMLEAAVVTGGWGLSLLPIHCVSASEARRERAARALRRRRRRRHAGR